MVPVVYDEPLFRPPSEGKSAIFQATLGCSFNQCTFCGMYKMKKFKVRPVEEVTQEITEYAAFDPQVEKVFIADGDALILPEPYWLTLLDHCQKTFPRLRRVTSYATPQNILRKKPKQLKAIRDAGLEMLYMGVESGDPETIDFIVKGVSREQIIEAGCKAKEAGFRLSDCTGLLGIAGKTNSQRHGEQTATIFNAIQPDFIGILIWMEVPGADLLERAPKDFQMINEIDSLRELRTIVSGLNQIDCQFRSNHASNYLPLKGHLPTDKQKLVDVLNLAIDHPNEIPLKPEWLRGT